MVSQVNHTNLKYSPKHVKHKGKLCLIGKVSIYVRSGSYQLRFSVANKQQSVTVGSVCETTFKTAIKRSLVITDDIANGCYDWTKSKYNVQANNENNVIAIKETSLIDVWNKYKEFNATIIAKTTQKSKWQTINNALSKLSKQELSLSNLNGLYNALNRNYSVESCRMMLRVLNAALNLHYGTKQDYVVKLVPKKQKSKIEYFKPSEVNSILDAFKNDTYRSEFSKFDNDHSYYFGYVALCALTGCRPEEICALTWDDIKFSNNGKTCQIVINKAYSKYELMTHTKNYKARIIPCSSKLTEIIRTLPKRHESLVVCSREGSYMDSKNFRNRQWVTVLNGLVNDGKIQRYIKPYALRHSYATNLLRNGVDIATVAGLLGDLVKTVIDNYLGSDYENANLPEIY
jgi:integrase